MSTHARSINYYRRMRRLASLCDEASRPAANSEVRQRLGEILVRSARGEFESFSDLLLVTLSEERMHQDPAKLERLASALLSNQVDEEHLQVMRSLSDALHHETAQALSRLRGG